MSDAPRKRAKVLVVDDEPIMRANRLI